MASDLKLEVQLGLTEKLLGPFKRVRQGAGDVSKALAATRDQVKALQTQQADVSGYRKANIEIIKQGRELRALQGTVDGHNASLTAARAEHDKNSAAMRTAKTAYNKLAKALIDGKANGAEFRHELEKARIRLAAADKEFVRTQHSVKLWKDRIRHADDALKGLTGQHGKAKQRLTDLKGRLDAAGIGTDNLSRKAREQRDELQKLNGVYDQHKDKLKQVNDLQKRNEALNAAHGKSMAHAAMVGGGGYAMLNAGRSATNSLMGPVRAYSDFEDAMAGVAKQVEGARDANGQLTPTYYQMADAIKGMAERIPMATTEIAALVEGGARMGIQGKDNLLAFAEVAANAATAFELPADQLGEDLARIADLYKLPMKNVGQLGDAINYLDDNAKSKGADIIDVLQRTAGITASVGMSFKDAAALGSTFLTLGASAEVAGTATNAMIRELAIATEQPKRFQKGLAQLGLDAKALQKGMAKDATGTIQQVMEALSKLPKENQLTVATQLFGKEYGDDASKLAQNIGEYRRQLELANAEAGKGSMQKEADIKAQLLSARWLMTQNKLFNTLSEAGEALKPVLIDLMDAASGFLGGLRDWIKENPALAGGILQAATGLTVLATVLGAGAVALAGFMAPFSLLQFTMGKLILNSAGTSKSMAQLFPTFIKLGNGIRFVGTSLLGLAANPAAWIILAVVAAIAGAAYLIYRNWEPIKGFFVGLWEDAKAAFDLGIFGIMKLLANWSPLGLLWRGFTMALEALGIDVPEKFRTLGGALIDGLLGGLFDGLGKLKAGIMEVGDSMYVSLKEKLGIHSPSRVFAELGGFTMAGLAQGLTKNQGGPLGAVVDMGKKLAAAGAVTLGMAGPALAMDNRAPLSPVPAAGARAAATSLPPVTVNVYPSAGMNEQQLAQLVGQKVAEAMRASQIRNRSSLSDQE